MSKFRTGDRVRSVQGPGVGSIVDPGEDSSVVEVRGDGVHARVRLRNDQLVLDESPPDEPEEPLPDALVARYERIEAALQLVRDNVELPDPIHEIVREALKETE